MQVLQDLFYVPLQLLVVAAVILSFKFYCKFYCMFYFTFDPLYMYIPCFDRSLMPGPVLLTAFYRLLSGRGLATGDWQMTSNWRIRQDEWQVTNNNAKNASVWGFEADFTVVNWSYSIETILTRNTLCSQWCGGLPHGSCPVFYRICRITCD